MEMEMNEAQREEHDRFNSGTVLDGRPVVNRKQKSTAVADIHTFFFFFLIKLR